MEPKATLCAYLQSLRDTVLWKVEGLPERDLRMPMTASGTNLLGLVKHLAGVEAEYFGACLGRPWPEPSPWPDAHAAEPESDMWATAQESPEHIIGLYRQATARAAETVVDLPLETAATVPWWTPTETTLGRLLVHMTAETARHAGHMDILRESVDGQRGLLPSISGVTELDDMEWADHVARLRLIAEASRA